MFNAEYERRIDDLVGQWRDEVYEEVLGAQVMPAVKIYAFASLQDLTDVYDVSAIFPMFADQMGELPDHYANGVFARLSGACTSIRNALQAIRAHMDCHAAVAAARRAHEALWQVFWLCNPAVDAGARMNRLVALNKSEIQEALRFWTGLNPVIEGQLRGFLGNIQGIAGLPQYKPKDGWIEYMEHFESSVDGSMDNAARSWSIMSNMTHANLVFDWIIQSQDDSQDEMDRLQLIPTVDAMGMVGNLCTLIMERAQIPEEHIVEVNATVGRSWVASRELLGLRRRE